MFKKIIILKIILLGLIFGIVLGQAFSKVIEEKGKLTLSIGMASAGKLIRP